ncbi:hypothetical protein M9Y10_025644 [Tritrichomonas musculus]|uniref:Uncharacterized protein n=1 Tax=Tritrichomonas musculus TaxID=1915356 RepID=A0ABR2H9A0_9EUKA
MTFADLQQITNSKEDDISCDLSIISIDYYDQLQELILKYGFTKIGCLSINCSTADKYRRAVTKARKEKGKKAKVPPPASFEGSIYSQRNRKEANKKLILEGDEQPNYLAADIVALMARLLPKTKSLKSLTLSSIMFTPIDFDILFQALSLNKSLRSLKIQGIPIKSEVFAKLCEALKHKFIINLTIKNCNLKDKIVDSFLSLIKYHTSIQKKAERIAERQRKHIGLVCISNINFRDNKFTTTFVQKIVSTIDSSPVFRLDLRDNIPIPASYKLSPKIMVGCYPTFSSSSLRMQKHHDYKSRELADERQLERENQKLKNKLDILDNENVATIAKRMYAVGDRADEFVEHINQLDKLCTYLSKKKQ